MELRLGGCLADNIRYSLIILKTSPNTMKSQSKTGNLVDNQP